MGDAAGTIRPIWRTPLAATLAGWMALVIGLIGFGGVNAWARRVIVEEKHWLTEQEYAEVLGLGGVVAGGDRVRLVLQIDLKLARRIFGDGGRTWRTAGSHRLRHFR